VSHHTNNATESSKQHSHSHNNDDKNVKTKMTLPTHFKSAHPHSTPDPSTRLERLFLFLEAQFGEDAVSPITLPRNSISFDNLSPPTFTVAASPTPAISPEDKAELKRLHSLGIPVPGIEIKFDKYVAKVWLEDLEVECKSQALRARVKAVVERGVETVSGLWS